MDNNNSIIKTMSIKWHGHRYCVQEMPTTCGMERKFAVMKDRRQLCHTKYDTEKLATGWLLAYLCRELDQLQLNLSNLTK